METADGKRHQNSITLDQAPGAPVQFTEMLPGPEECWLQSASGHRTSEPRIVAVDRSAIR
jgi:hypothetical protein